MKYDCEQVYADAIAAGCDVEFARLLALVVTDPKNAAAMVSARAPTNVKKALLLNKSLKTDSQRIAAFKNATEVQALLHMHARGRSWADASQFTERDADGNVSVMAFARVSATIANRMASEDAYIDTAPPSDTGAMRGNNVFNDLANEIFAKRVSDGVAAPKGGIK